MIFYKHKRSHTPMYVKNIKHYYKETNQLHYMKALGKYIITNYENKR